MNTAVGDTMEGTSHLRFKHLAPFYDSAVRLCGLMLGGEETVRRKALDLLPLAGGETLLEIGCGTGTVMTLLSRRLQAGGRIVGLDPSPEMLVRARRKLSSFNGTMVIKGSGGELPFADCSMDGVICFLSLHEMVHADRLATLQEAARVLKPAGYLLIGELRRPSSLIGRIALGLLLAAEEDEARDFLQRGVEGVIHEAVGSGRLLPVTRSLFAGGVGQGLLLQRATQ